MIRMLLAAALAVAMAAAASAQERLQMQVMRAEVVDTRLSQEFRSAMERGDFAEAAALARGGTAVRAEAARGETPAPRPAPSASMQMSGSVAAPVDPADYTCNSGNCACAGASDCVAMAPHCVDGTIGCNDYGCTCKEADG